MSKKITINCDGCGGQIMEETYYAVSEKGNGGIYTLDWANVTNYYCRDCWNKMTRALKASDD